MPKRRPSRPMQRRMLAAALGYAKRGRYVFPIEPGTRCSYKSKGYSGGRRWGATIDKREIHADFARWPDANIGMATGGLLSGFDPGIFIIETDTPQGHNVDGEASLRKLEAELGPLPETLMAISPSGSKHHYFRHPGDLYIKNSASRLGAGVDVRGDGGMVLAPPSVKPGVGTYRWLNDKPLASLPAAWLRRIEQTAKPRVIKKPKIEKAKVKQLRTIAPSIGSSPDALQELADARAELTVEKEGGRNDALNRHAFYLGQLVGGERLDEETAREHLAEAARECGLEEDEIAATIESGMEAGKLQPREANWRGRKSIRLLRRPPLARSGDVSLAAIRARVRREIELRVPAGNPVVA